MGSVSTRARGDGSVGAHAVHVYDDVLQLAEPVAAFLAGGFEVGEPAVVLATAEHWRHLAAELERRGCDVAALEADGMLTIADADATLGTFTRGSAISSADFERNVGGLLSAVGARWPGRPIRAFGEMVDVLCARGDVATAMELEDLWNDLSKRYRFSLLCAYRLDLFDRAVQVSAMPDVCCKHSHVSTSADPERFERAVDAAMGEVLGPTQAGRVYALVAPRLGRDGGVPLAELALMWVSANMPSLADRVLNAAREHYAQPAIA